MVLLYVAAGSRLCATGYTYTCALQVVGRNVLQLQATRASCKKTKRESVWAYQSPYHVAPATVAIVVDVLCVARESAFTVASYRRYKKPGLASHDLVSSRHCPNLQRR